MKRVFMTTQSANVSDPVTIVIPIRWMNDFRQDLNDEAFAALMQFSFSSDYVDWNDYNVSGSISSAERADEQTQEAWLEALGDYLYTFGVKREDIMELVPKKVLTGWDTVIGSSEEETWLEMLDEHENIDELVIFTTFDDLNVAKEKMVDVDKTLKLDEFINDAYGYRGSWNSSWAEGLLKTTEHLPKGWYEMNYFSVLGGSPQSLNYAKLKV
tara:strand:+ start:794 stop:1432 length:639 start_codon:yes stop_codon:yes gene_type:complete